MSNKQIFISHTKKDVRFCDFIDRFFARASIKAFRSEYENIRRPEWQTIKKEMDSSIALFLLVGPELAKNQSLKNIEWSYTQNWIAYEIGLACQLGIDVWAICDDNVSINFPMPYINNYYPMKIGPLAKLLPQAHFKTNPEVIYFKGILDLYDKGMNIPFTNNINGKPFGITCKNCGAQFNLHPAGVKRTWIKCPQCLKTFTQSSIPSLSVPQKTPPPFLPVS